MADCVFCKIARGEIPSHKVHDDARVMAFLDIRPLTKGHALIVPKRHAVKLEDLDAPDAQALMAALHALGPRLCAAVGAPASTIAIHNGKEAGQEVPHLHVHVVPRTAGDGGGPIHALFRNRPTVADADLARLAESVRAAKKPA